MQTFVFVYDENESVRVDVFTANAVDITRSRAAAIIENGGCFVNGRQIGKNYKLKYGDELRVNVAEAIPLNIEEENIPLDIVYEDEDLLVVNKSKGMVVHPAPGNYNGTLVNALMYHCKDNLSGINGVMRPGIIHRIDKNTSGLLIVAKNDKSHLFLSEQIKSHSFTREYEAIAYGGFKNKEGTVDAPIGRHPVNRKQMAVTEKNSKNAVTHYTVLYEANGFSYIRLKLETGRTHQIRVHMAYLGHPLAGDDVYGPKKVISELKGQCLHARKIGFIHPTTHKYMEFESKLPDYFTGFLEKYMQFTAL